MKEKNEIESKLMIYYDEPFWVGVFEELDGGKLSVCRTVFGAEPTDAAVYDFILRHYYHLRFSAPVKTEVRQKADNPKRRQRNARKQLEKAGIGTKSQQALQKQYEENKMERKQKSREQKEAEKQRQFELKQKKRKEKRRGH
ncbi:MAG: YjdF family protein [Ruminococcus sp.]|nr:YjdF family protein [Ruminococcus sp.]